MSTKSDSFLQKVENGHSVHWIQKPRKLVFVYLYQNIDETKLPLKIKKNFFFKPFSHQ